MKRKFQNSIQIQNFFLFISGPRFVSRCPQTLSTVGSLIIVFSSFKCFNSPPIFVLQASKISVSYVASNEVLWKQTWREFPPFQQFIQASPKGTKADWVLLGAVPLRQQTPIFLPETSLARMSRSRELKTIELLRIKDNQMNSCLVLLSLRA